MEGIHSVVGGNSEVQDARVIQSVDGCPLSSNGFKARDNMTNDSSSYEKFLLDDLDSYWDELNDRLSVSRMVSSSVTKGIVNAVDEEAKEKIASKEAEITILNERLHAYESKAGTGVRSESLVVMPEPSVKGVLESAKSLLDNSSLDTSLEWDYTQYLSRFRIRVQEQIQMLKEDLECVRRSNLPCKKYVDVGLCCISPQESNEKLLKIDERVDGLQAILAAGFGQINDMFCSMKALVWEQKWLNEFQGEVSGVMIRSYIKDLWDESETKLYEKTVAMKALNKNWQKKIAELTNLHEELHAISKSLLNSELGIQHSHNSPEIFEEWSVAKKKDHFPRIIYANQHSPSPAEENGDITQEKYEDSAEAMLEVDFSHLEHMTKEEMISHFKTEMTMMKRQHESTLQEMTEALFKLKREFLKARGSLHLRKDKEYENLRKIIPEITSKLNEILVENRPICNDHDELRSFKDIIDTLFFENQRLRGLLAGKTEEVKCLLLQGSAAANQMSLHSSAEANFMKQISQLKGDMEDLKIETNLREELYKHILRELIVDQKFTLEDMEISARTVQDVFSIMFGRVVQDAMSSVNSNLSNYHMEKTSLQENLFEKENTLSLATEENQRLKQNIALLSALMKEKEKLASETGSTLMQQKEQFDSVHQECNILRNQLGKQEIQILNFKVESDSMNSRLDQASQQIHDYELEIEKLNQKLRSISNELDEAEKQKTILQRFVEEKQKSSLSSISTDKQQAKKLMELSKAVMDFESKLAENIKRTDSRLKILSHKLSPLAQHVRQLKEKELWYNQMLEIRCSNLQKAEAEVDILGDEVDALLDLLEKIYIALDHYSPILRHYPGVMEILKLVERELKGENN